MKTFLIIGTFFLVSFILLEAKRFKLKDPVAIGSNKKYHESEYELLAGDPSNLKYNWTYGNYTAYIDNFAYTKAGTFTMR